MVKSMYYRIPVGDILIRQGHDRIPIAEHAYHQALVKRDGRLYEKVINKSPVQQSKKSGTWKGFRKLKRRIERDGYQHKRSDPITMKFAENGRPYVSHGRHRIVLLRYIHGADSRVTVKMKNGVGEVIGISRVS